MDTNVVIDLADGVEDVHDAIELIRRRVKGVEFIVPPGVLVELAYLSSHAAEKHVRDSAAEGLRSLTKWKFKAVNHVPGGHTVTGLGHLLRANGLLPAAEKNDSEILVQSALLECVILLTTDADLRGIDREVLSILLKATKPPIIATPREVVGKFFR